MTNDMKLALEMARFFRMRGWNPLPSCMEGPTKQPIFRYADLWNQVAPAEWFADEQWGTTNLQIMTGRHWRLLVIDLDGAEARERWAGMGRSPRTWVVHRDGGESQHLWFRLPPNMPDRIPKGFIWRGPEPHTGIERLCDQSLAVAPPSFHVVHRESRYKFIDAAHSPERLPMPADCPTWILRLPLINAVAAPAPVQRPRHDPSGPSGPHLDRDAVLAGVRDKVGLAKRFGLRVTGRRTHAGWHECRAIGRDDNRPSAAIHESSGVYKDQGTNVRLPFLDLVAHLCGLPSWREALRVVADAN